MEEAVEKQYSGNFRNALLALIRCARNISTFFAMQLHNSMKVIYSLRTCAFVYIQGIRLQHRDLTRVCVTRCERDMIQIKKEYEQLYGTTLEKDIQVDMLVC